LAKETILIVEDEGTMRALLTKTLEEAGYLVLQAEDGDAGYQMAKTAKPDLIISDIIMPQMDGNQLMKKLRESPFGKNIPFMVVSARGQMKEYFEVMNADDFITKPYDSEDLLRRVSKVLAENRKDDDSDTDASDGKKVLLLDNEPVDCEKYKKALMDSKYEVSVVTSLEECLKTAESFRPVVIAVRFMVDQTNADKIVKVIKQQPGISGIPVVVYSRKIRGWEEKKVKDAGAHSFLGEVTDDKLVAAVQQAAG